MPREKEYLAIWALTAQGAALGRRIRGRFPNSRLFCSRRSGACREGVVVFDRLRDALPGEFHQFRGHVFIMAAGIVVRAIAGLLVGKTEDPAVIVVDETGCHAISLLSGHLGGANDLACRIGRQIGARPVITTATDLRNVPAIDLVAQARGLIIENPTAIRHVSMALLENHPVRLHDPAGWLAGALPERCLTRFEILPESEIRNDRGTIVPGVWVDDIRIDLPEEILILRPPSLFVGVGCNRNTAASEIRDFLSSVLARRGLAPASVAAIASIDLKSDEAGLLEAAASLSRPLVFFSREELGGVAQIPSPSTVVENHVGVKGVCEAAAILASGGGRLIVTKQIDANTTIAIARISSTSSD